MKIHALLALSLALISCKEKSSMTANPDASSPPKITAEEHGRLIEQKIDLERDLGRIISERGDSTNDAIEAAKTTLNDAFINYRKVQDEHPKLREITVKLNTMKSRMKQVQSSGNVEEEELIQSEISQLSQNFNTLSKDLPEIKEAQNIIDQSMDELNTVRRNIARNIPEAKLLLESLDTIEKRLIDASR